MTQEEAVAAGSALFPDWDWPAIWAQLKPIATALLIQFLQSLLPAVQHGMAAPVDPWAQLSDDAKKTLADLLDRLRIKLLS